MSATTVTEEKGGMIEGIAKFFVNRAELAVALGIMCLGMGAMSVMSIPKESAPNIAFGIVSVSTEATGFSASAVDSLITREVLREVKGLRDLRKVTANSYTDVSSVTLEFNLGTDMTRVLTDVQNAVSRAEVDFPAEVTRSPRITEIDSSQNAPLVTVIMTPSTDNFPTEALAERAFALRDLLEGTKGVSDATLSGVAEEEVLVRLDARKLEAMGVSYSEVKNAIRDTHTDAPLGSLRGAEREVSFRIGGRHQSAEDIENVVVKSIPSNRGGAPSLVRVSDVATVSVGQTPLPDSLFSFGAASEDGGEISVRRGVELTLVRRSAEDIFQTRTSIEEALEAFRADNPQLQLTTIRDETEVMREDYRFLLQTGVQAFLVVFALLVIFVGLVEGAVASLVIPLTFLSSVWALALLGQTLNFMTNFSMILALGILVDTAIIIVEGMRDGMRRGMTPRESALFSVREYSAPLVAGTITTLVVFMPLLDLPDIMGEFLAKIPITVGVVLIFALLFSMFLLPVYGAILLRKQATKSRLRRAVDGYIDRLGDLYSRALSAFLHTHVLRSVGIVAVFVGFFLSLAVPVPFVLFPDDDGEVITLELEYARGTSPNYVHAEALRMGTDIATTPEIRTVSLNTDAETATITAEMHTSEFRKERQLRKTADVEIMFQQMEDEFPGARLRARRSSVGPEDLPVAILVAARGEEDIEAAKTITRQAEDLLRAVPGAVGVRSNMAESSGNVRFSFDAERAADIGVTLGAIREVLRAAAVGDVPISLQRTAEDIDVRLMFAEDLRPEDLSSIRIPTATGNWVSASDVLEPASITEASMVPRRDGRVAFTVSSLLGPNGNATKITDTFFENLPQELQNHPQVEIIAVGENEENAAVLAAMAEAGVVAIFLLGFVLLVQFGSLFPVLLILLTGLFSQIGVSMGLVITDTPRSLASILGIITLLGIIVNDAIVLLTRIRRLRQAQPTRAIEDVCKEAGRSRFIPIILTTLTTSAGILPLAFVDEFWRGMAFTVLFGLSMASALTLFFTPAFLVTWERSRWRFVALCVGGSALGLGASSLIG